VSEAALASNSQNYAQSAVRASSASGADLPTQMFEKFEANKIQQAIEKVAAGYLSELVGALIEMVPMAQFMKNDAMAKVKEALDPYEKNDSPRELEQGVDKMLGKDSKKGDDIAEGLMDMLKSSMKEETESASSSGAGGRGSGNGNWLAVLARALGKTAGEHLKKMVELGEKMGGLDSKENPEKFAEVQSEFQAEAQVFKMFQEAISTMTKNIGEGMATVARKQ